MVESEREVAGQRRVEQRVYLCSLAPDARLLAQAVRGHWGIENQLHWVLDVPLGEDDSRVRTGHAAENLATLRKLVLNLLRRDTQTKVGTRAKQLKAAWDHACLQSLRSPCRHPLRVPRRQRRTPPIPLRPQRPAPQQLRLLPERRQHPRLPLGRRPHCPPAPRLIPGPGGRGAWISLGERIGWRA